MIIKNIIVFLLLSAGCYSQATVDSLLVMADQQYEEQNYATALTSYLEYIEADNSSLVAYKKAATSAHRLGDLPLARSLYLILETKDSSNITALSSLASIYELQQNTPKAIKYYTKLIELSPENAVYFRKLAQQYQGAGLYNDAKKFFYEALTLNNKDQFTIKGLSTLLLKERSFAQTDSLLKIGLARDSLNVSLNLLMANSQYLQKAYDKTVRHMEVLKGKYDFKPHQNKMLGYAYMQVDSIDKAIHFLTKAINDVGTKEYAHYNLGVAYEKKGDKEYALHHFKKAIEAGVSDDVDLYHRNAARLYSMEENIKEAIPHYKDAYKYGEDPIVLFYLGRAADNYYKDKSIAIRYYSKFISSSYDHPDYIEYAKARKRYLKEYQHQQK